MRSLTPAGRCGVALQDVAAEVGLPDLDGSVAHAADLGGLVAGIQRAKVRRPSQQRLDDLVQVRGAGREPFQSIARTRLNVARGLLLA